MRNTRETIEWYRNHETASQIGYNPDGMCLKLCREARGIGSLYPSAKAAQDATPREHRVTDVSKIRRGMVVYYDDPRDSNRFGHIVTVVGRVQGADPSALGSLLVRTNSVESGKVVVVRGDYFGTYWGDSFQFAATWLNGQVLDLGPVVPPKPEPKPTPRPTAVSKARALLWKAYKRAKGERRRTLGEILRRAPRR